MPTMLKFSLFSFNQLDNHILYRLLQMRAEVFVVEQTCPYLDLDDKDTHPEVLHLLGYQDEHCVAYARCLPPGLSYESPSIGRVLVTEQARGKGYAYTLMQEAIAQCQQQWPGQGITIGAQVYLQNFYQKVNFLPISDVYLEDDIEHIDMVLPGE